nr:ADP-ribosylglycohydrolase family protein [Rhodococcus sp. (in: high G+C Gram-positive bacteria)]
MKLTAQQSDRAAGVLLGTAAGDALGAGYEFSYPAEGTVVDMIGGGPFDWAPGEWTDDTSMAAAVALAAREVKDLGSVPGLDVIAANFVAWYDTDPADIGNQTRSVLGYRSRTAAEMTTRAASLTGRTGGNGSLMRTAPVALAYLDDPERCVAAAAAVSALTHSDPRAGEACQMWSAAIRHAVLDGTFDGVRLWTDTAAAGDFWRPLLDEAELGEPADFAKNGWVVHALQTAWWAITRADGEGPDHLVRALELCVLAGGDTDTTAAIAGGLLGARWGASAVPLRWRAMLHGYPSLTGEDLVTLAADITGDLS